MIRLVRAAPLIAVLLFSGAAAAVPFRPTDDEQVLERLPVRALSADSRAPTPRDPATAAVIARAYIERSRRDGDPRFLGYAEGVLQPWWRQTSPPAPVLLLRATLLQSRHRFAEALRDLDSLLGMEPADAQALLTRATVLRVLGRYGEAGRSCTRLRGIADEFVVALCEESVRGLNGGLPAAARALDSIAAESTSQSLPVRTWYRAERAEMAERLGDDAGALALYRLALTEDPEDPLLRASAADLLLRLARPQEALDITGADPLADVLRLRAALALRASGRPRADLEASLSDAYAAAHRRGEDVHLREEARFSLEILGDAARALALAQHNWSVQREPADAKLLQLVARAAGRSEAAEPVREWLRESHLEDARLLP